MPLNCMGGKFLKLSGVEWPTLAKAACAKCLSAHSAQRTQGSLVSIDAALLMGSMAAQTLAF